MDRTFVAGLGVTIAFGLLPYAIADIPRWVSWAGLASAVAVMVWAALPGFDGVSVATTFLFVVSCAGAGATLGWRYSDKTAELRSQETSQAVPNTDNSPQPHTPGTSLVAPDTDKTPEPHSLEPSQARPTFDIADTAQAELNRTVVSGSPSGILVARGNAKFITNDSVIIEGKFYVETPPPNGELSKLSSRDLKMKVATLANDLQIFQSKMDKENIANPIDWQKSLDTADVEFNTTLRNRGLDLMSEILHRIGPIERRPLPLTMRCGIDALNFGKLTGDHPASGAAVFLEFIADKLPA